MEDGRIIAEGSHDALLKSDEIYRTIYETQSGNSAHGRISA
jgi:ABC-type multidrug transport system fused ATPase/permease subunit